MSGGLQALNAEPRQHPVDAPQRELVAFDDAGDAPRRTPEQPSRFA